MFRDRTHNFLMSKQKKAMIICDNEEGKTKNDIKNDQILQLEDVNDDEIEYPVGVSCL